jgi:uncharacterized protein with von Willebrand factor type A (vWA) domain
MLDDLSRIANSLRQLGVHVSVEQQVDAAKALVAIDPLDRAEVYAALSAILVRREEHQPALLTLLDIFLNSSPFTPSNLVLANMDDAALRSMLHSAMRHFDKHSLRLVAAEAVRRHSGFAPGRPVGGTYYVTRTLRWLNLDQIEQDIAEPVINGAERLAIVDLSRRRTQFIREAVDTAVRGMLVADRGADELARLRRAPLLDDIDFMNASADQLRQLERAIIPVARRLARRLSRKARSPNLPDMRNTMRRAMTHGGTVLDMIAVKRLARLPQIVVLADVSGSVASFARFTISLLRAMSQSFSRAHYFAFADGFVDVTKAVRDSREAVDLADLLRAYPGLVQGDGRTDYAYAFQMFLEKKGKELEGDVIVLILGDGRNNYRASGEEALMLISNKVRQVHWLNPESSENWGQGDSAMHVYQKHLASVVECRNLRQLQRFVAQMV